MIVSDFALSERCIKAFKESDLTGLDIAEQPIELKNSDLVYYMTYAQIAFVRLDMKASGAIVRKVNGCDICHSMTLKKMDRLCLVESSWNGEDVFRTPNCAGSIVVTQRFVDFVHENNFHQFQFQKT